MYPNTQPQRAYVVSEKTPPPSRLASGSHILLTAQSPAGRRKRPRGAVRFGRPASLGAPSASNVEHCRHLSSPRSRRRRFRGWDEPKKKSLFGEGNWVSPAYLCGQPDQECLAARMRLASPSPNSQLPTIQARPALLGGPADEAIWETRGERREMQSSPASETTFYRTRQFVLSGGDGGSGPPRSFPPGWEDVPVPLPAG